MKGLTSLRVLGGALAAIAGAESCGPNFADVVQDFDGRPGVVSGIPFYDSRRICRHICEAVGPCVKVGGTTPRKLDAKTDSGEFVTDCVEDPRCQTHSSVSHVCVTQMVGGRVTEEGARLETVK
jgi:hypothetical protein